MTLFIAGNSILAATGVGLSTVANGCIPLLNADLHLTADNMALNGHQVPDQAALLFTRNVLAADIALIGLGTNEVRLGGSDPDKRRFFIDGLRSLIVYCAARIDAVGPALSAVFTGTWTIYSAGYYSYGSCQVGAKVSWSFAGSACMLSMIRQYNNGGQFKVTIDGACKGTFNTGGDVRSEVGASFGPYSLVFDGLSAGSHSIEVEIVTGGAAVSFAHWFSTFAPKARVAVFNIANNKDGTQGADIAAYNADIAALVLKLQGYGLGVYLADINTVIGPDHMFDRIHWNDAGHMSGRNAAYQQLTGSPAPVLMQAASWFGGSDGFAYFGQPGNLRKFALLV